MKKNNITLIVCLLLGLLAGMIIGEIIAPLKALEFLTKSANVTWEPKADLGVIKYDLYFQVKLNLISLFGLVAGFFVYRKL